MRNNTNYFDFLPQILPQKMSGKITTQICLNNHKRTDGTNAIYIRLYQNRIQKKINLNISVPESQFDKKKQRVRPTFSMSDDYNLLIEKQLSDINKIMIEFRLSNINASIDKIIKALQNPGARSNFNLFAEQLLKKQHKDETIKFSTYKQQKSSLTKIKNFQDPLFFSEISIEWLESFQGYLRKTLKNNPTTVAIATKNFKKYIHAAHIAGIKSNIEINDIKVKRYKSNFTFLLPEEVRDLHKLYKKTNAFDWKCILQRYLFSCFTGLRLGDVNVLEEDNFVGDVLIFKAKKTDKLQRIKLNKTALGLIELPEVFKGEYSDQYINRELKNIAKAVGIKKRLYYHSSRHTFATNYLLSGGQLINLQKLLGHSKIETTMIYAHVIESLLDKEIENLDAIIS